MNYVGLNINGWIVKDVENVRLNDRNRIYLICECPNCNEIRKVRSDKRNSIQICSCNAFNSSDDEKRNDNENLINIEWEKIKDSGICSSKEEMVDKYLNNKVGKFYKINVNRPFSVDNYIYGNYDDVKEYYRKKSKEKEEKKREILEKVNKNKIRCPYCGAFSLYINSCSFCKMSFIKDNSLSIFQKNNKTNINLENNRYTEKKDHFSFENKKHQEKLVPISDVKANYFSVDNKLFRIGIIVVSNIDYVKQGTVGIFQGINSDGSMFQIRDVFQYFSSFPYVFVNGDRVEKDKIHLFNSQNEYTYVFQLQTNENNPLSIMVYKDKCVSIVDKVAEIWGFGFNSIYFMKKDGSNYILNLETCNVAKTFSSKPKMNEQWSSARNIVDTLSEYIVFFNKKVFKSSLLLHELLSKNCVVNSFVNEFEDDNTENYMAVIKKDDYDTLDTYYYLLNKNTNLLLSNSNNFAIYGYPLFKIFKNFIFTNKEDVLKVIDCKLRDEIECIIDDMADLNNNLDKYEIILEKLKLKYQCNTLDLLKIMIEKYGICEVFGIYYYSSKVRLDGANLNYIKEQVDCLEEKISKQSQPVWKSEYELYNLIKFYYSDAIFQYKDARFQGLILDIYVPSLNTAFEYQGIQHYEEVLRFDDMLDKRRENDALKKKLCLDYNIKLIEWKYDEEITKLVLDEKIKFS